MVERIVRAVIDDGVEVGRILAITFTEKAAGELADRVRDRFLELERYDAARDAGARMDLDHPRFCARVLRAHALAAGVDPEFRVLDETDAAWLRRAAFEDALEEMHDAEDGEDALGDLAPLQRGRPPTWWWRRTSGSGAGRRGAGAARARGRRPAGGLRPAGVGGHRLRRRAGRRGARRRTRPSRRR